MASYLFYDLETSGLNKAFDQVLQFAGKRLSLDLTQEMESHFLEAKLTKDIIPSPKAMLTHGIGTQGHENSMDECTVAGLIHRQMNQANTISLGYNTLGFDDEFLRFTFYRNLLSPYTHQFADGCRRMDLFPMAIFYYLYAPQAIAWPQIEGRVSLKLEHLGQENQWLKGKAHHAMTDVDMTISLAKSLYQANPEAWDYLIGFFDKLTDSKRIEQLPEAFHQRSGHHLGLMITSQFGNQSAFQAPVISLGRHNHYKNQIVFLRLDRPFNAQDEFQDLQASGAIIRKKLAEPGFILPYDEHYGRHMSDARKQIVAQTLGSLRLNLDYLDNIAHAAREYTYPSSEFVDADASLYDSGFRSRDEEQLCAKFHLSTPELKVDMLAEFKNPVLRELAARMCWRHSNHPLPLSEAQLIEAHTNKILNSEPILDYRDNYRYSLELCMKETK